MEKFKYLQSIKEIYSNGDNIMQFLKNLSGETNNTIEDILISYDFQSGSYIKALDKNKEYNNNYAKTLAKIIEDLGINESIMEAGVGEATTLTAVLRNLKNRPVEILGFDISWSRLKFAKSLLNDFGMNKVKLFTANLFEIPLPDSSVDIVYTSHSIEPNGGKEEMALKELYRVTGKYLVLLEPSYDFASEEAKARMKKNGYVTELYSTALKLNYKVIEHRLFDYSSNPLNPTGIIIIEKGISGHNKPDWVCPISHTHLMKYSKSLLYSKESFLAFPVIEDIPCLLKDNSILAAHLLTDYEEFKKANNISY